MEAARRHIGSDDPPDTQIRVNGEWTEEEVKILVSAWCEGADRQKLSELLPGRSYPSISMKIFRLGLPRRTENAVHRKPLSAHDLLKEDAAQPGQKYLDYDYTDEEEAAALAPPPKPKITTRPCRHCRRLTAFDSPYLLWCSDCREIVRSMG